MVGQFAVVGDVFYKKYDFVQSSWGRLHAECVFKLNGHKLAIIVERKDEGGMRSKQFCNFFVQKEVKAWREGCTGVVGRCNK